MHKSFLKRTFWNKNVLLSISTISLLAVTGCSKLKPLTADNFTVTPNPLETTGGKVTATIDGRFPAKYMKKKAVVTVIPVLQYNNGQDKVTGQSATFQGEKVQGNNQTILYKVGGKYTMKTTFDYLPEMQKSDLVLAFDAKVGKKTVKLPAITVAHGVIATEQLYKETMAQGGLLIAPDTFQRVRQERQEANIKFLINQANIRKSELKNNSVQEFVRLLNKINKERESLNLKNVEVKAYASPEGGFAFNDKLAGKRKETGTAYVKDQLKKSGNQSYVDAEYTAQDWEGFQQLVKASNLQDKEVILRVLSMYKDPQERERQIRNMSAGFQELASAILPALRRARLIVNYETIGRSDEEIQKQFGENPALLSVDELLYAATLTKDAAQQEAIYKKTAEIYDRDYRAFNNLAVLAFQNGEEKLAEDYLNKAIALTPNAHEATANLGLLALKKGQLDVAESYIAKANSAKEINKALGLLNIAKGNYAQAEQYLAEQQTNSAALAQLLNKNYAAATTTLTEMKQPNAMTHYLMAVVKARQGQVAAAAEALRKAVQADPKLAQYAANDLELAKVNK